MSYASRLSVAILNRFIKVKTSRKLLLEYTEIRKKFWGSHISARGYFTVSTGNVTDELIAEYKDKQDIE